MLDPFPPPPLWLKELVQPWAEFFRLHSLPDHIHEVLFAFALYQFIHSYLSPRLSTVLFPRSYPYLPPNTRLNWNVHVVSFVQSTLISLLGLWVMFADRERKGMTTGERIYGYTGACGLVQALATGYFLYDLIVSTIYLEVFGIGMFFHAVSALLVYTLGFYPFINFYAPTFILYELSSPFLNIHWFLDKVNMTGSRAQWYNGMTLLFVFFSCRLFWGTWQSVVVNLDFWEAVKHSSAVSTDAAIFQTRDGITCANEACIRANAEVSSHFQHNKSGIPLWMIVTNVIANLILNVLNYYWFAKMIETVLKRFREPPAPSKKAVLDAVAKLAEEEELCLGINQIGNENGSAVVNSTTGSKAIRRRKA